MVDRKTGRPLISNEYVIAPGPAAGEATRRKLESSAWGQAHVANHSASPFDRRRIRKPRADQ